ncbi:hypothetical protein A9R04_27310 [Nocardiopsis dassonvillei]|uniref:hypothetical protein n=1 Tax=Nocardiopsis dassonvillei TaxID=2014 RepID=UPI0008FC701E|nr:hypothetical protein [Nocardiopsis dassonvillei]APC38149.1 hypothetical protein A9R04_27310 [Nocardiopsis dassonvillei]
MRQFSAALLSRALGPLIAFLSAPCGRHSTVAGRRRRRSTRVRRYVPASPPPPAPLPHPRLTPPDAPFPAEDVALVRPYFTAHERSRAAASGVPVPRVPAPRVPELHAPVPRIPAAPRGPELASETEEVRHAFALALERAAVLRQRWKDDPGGDLLGEPAPRFGVVGAAGPRGRDAFSGLPHTRPARQRRAAPA